MTKTATAATALSTSAFAGLLSALRGLLAQGSEAAAAFGSGHPEGQAADALTREMMRRSF